MSASPPRPWTPDPISLKVDLADRRDVREKLPEARRILERKEASLRAHREDVDSWRQLVELLAVRAGVAQRETPDVDAPDEAPQRSNGQGASQHLDRVVSVVDRRVRPIRSREVAEILRGEGVEISNDAVSNTLYYAANRADPPRILKLDKRGVYAPLTYKEPQIASYSYDSPAERSFDEAGGEP